MGMKFIMTNIIMIHNIIDVKSSIPGPRLPIL